MTSNFFIVSILNLVLLLVLSVDWCDSLIRIAFLCPAIHIKTQAKLFIVLKLNLQIFFSNQLCNPMIVDLFLLKAISIQNLCFWKLMYCQLYFGTNFFLIRRYFFKELSAHVTFFDQMCFIFLFYLIRFPHSDYLTCFLLLIQNNIYLELPFFLTRSFHWISIAHTRIWTSPMFLKTLYRIPRIEPSA